MNRKAALILAIITILFLIGWRTYAQNPTVSLGTNGFNCVVAVSTAVTIQAVGGSCVAPGANVRLYITDIEFSTNAAGIAADSFNTLKTGTGGTCGSNTAVVYQVFTPAAAQAAVTDHLTTPIRLPINSELCWINTTAGSKALQVQGYIAP